MSIYFRAKWLQFLFKKHKNEGIAFYLGLLVLMIIFGVLAVMAFPRAGSCGGSSARYEGISYTRSMNRAQQGYYLENGAFVDSIPKLGIGIKTKTKDYEYFVRATKTAVFNYASSQKTASEPLKSYFGIASEPLNSYVGAVFLVSPSRLEKKKLKKKIEMLEILCETSSPTSNLPAAPTYTNGVLTCGENTKQFGYSSYVGAVFVVPATGVKSKAAATREMTTVAILCQANAPGAMKPVEPAYQNGEVACGSNTTEIYRYSP